MKKIFTLFAAGMLAFGVSAGDMVQQTAVLSWNNGTLGNADVEGTAGNNNCVSYENGFNIVLERTDKAYSSAKAIEVNGESLTTIKLSNGAANTLNAPEGCVINKVALYSYINYDRVAKGSEGRVCYWKQIGDNTYNEETGVILHDYLDVEGYASNPDKVEVEIPNLGSVKFVNAGEQLCFVLEVSYLTPGNDEPIPGEGNVWMAPEVGPIGAGAVLVDNDLLKATTVFDANVEPEAVAYDGYEFTNRMDVRVNAWPTVDNLSGTKQEDKVATPIILEAKQDIDITFVFRRQYKAPGYVAADGKDIAVFQHVVNEDGVVTKVEQLKNGEITVIEETAADSYANCAEKFTLSAGTYTICAKGTTLGLFGFIYKTKTTSVSDIVVEAEGEAVYYNLNGVRVANPERGLYIKVQGGKASKVIIK